MKRINAQIVLAVATLVFAFGGFVAVTKMSNAQAAADTRALIPIVQDLQRRADKQDERDLAFAEKLNEVANTLRAVAADLGDHKIRDAADAAQIQQNIREIERLRGAIR